MEVVSIVQPYAEKPLASTSDESEDDEADADGLSPAIFTRTISKPSSCK